MKNLFVDRHGPTALGIICSILGLIAATVWLFNTLLANGCARVCEANGDRSAYGFDIGCFCADEKGLYNPEDSRGDR